MINYQSADGATITVSQVIPGMNVYRAFFIGQPAIRPDAGYGESEAEAIVDLYHAMQTRIDFSE